MKHEAGAHLNIRHAQFDAVVVRLDEEPLVVDLPALLGVEVGLVEHHAALHAGRDAVHELLVVPDGQDFALAALELVFGLRGVTGRDVVVLGDVVRGCEAFLLKLVDGVNVKRYPILDTSGDALWVD